MEQGVEMENILYICQTVLVYNFVVLFLHDVNSRTVRIVGPSRYMDVLLEREVFNENRNDSTEIPNAEVADASHCLCLPLGVSLEDFDVDEQNCNLFSICFFEEFMVKRRVNPSTRAVNSCPSSVYFPPRSVCL